MGGCQRVSSSQQKTTNQASTPADPSPPTQPPDSGDFAHANADQQGKLPSSMATLALDQSPPDLPDDGEREGSEDEEEELERQQPEPDRTVGVEPLDKLSDLNTNGCSPPAAELQGETPSPSKLSLFSGMELVTKGMSPRVRETDVTEDTSTQAIGGISGSTSQPVSAFSFVNF